MSSRIIDRGRGPEIQGTRVTVYRLMDYVKEGAPASRIAAELALSDVQVQAGLDYISAHRDQVEQEYAKILNRVAQPNPEWIEEGNATSAEQLKQRIRNRQSQGPTHAGRRRQ
jgi:uncharacterized protein (DUF433 family)